MRIAYNIDTNEFTILEIYKALETYSLTFMAFPQKINYLMLCVYVA